jgi:hypothetical protein
MNFSDYKRTLARMVARAGDTPVIVSEKTHIPMYSYTLGNYPRYGIELIAFNIAPLWASLVFSDIRVSLDSDGPQILRFKEPNSLWTSKPVKYMVCNGVQACVYASRAFSKYGSKVILVQLVFPDDYGRFPEDPGYSCTSRTQPLLYL